MSVKKLETFCYYKNNMKKYFVYLWVKLIMEVGPQKKVLASAGRKTPFTFYYMRKLFSAKINSKCLT